MRTVAFSWSSSGEAPHLGRSSAVASRGNVVFWPSKTIMVKATRREVRTKGCLPTVGGPDLTRWRFLSCAIVSLFRRMVSACARPTDSPSAVRTETYSRAVGGEGSSPENFLGYYTIKWLNHFGATQDQRRLRHILIIGIATMHLTLDGIAYTTSLTLSVVSPMLIHDCTVYWYICIWHFECT